jgi:hypothetical protein
MSTNVNSLLANLRLKNRKKDFGLLAQTLFPKEDFADAIPSLTPEIYFPMSPMLSDRFQFAGRWENATAAFTWLSLHDMRSAWTDSQILESIRLRKSNWPDSVLTQYAPEKISIFALDLDEGNEIYLISEDRPEPLIVSYFEGQEDRYKNLSEYLSAWTQA